MGIRHQNSNVNQSPEVPEFHKIVALELSRHASDSRFQLRRATEQQNKRESFDVWVHMNLKAKSRRRRKTPCRESRCNSPRKSQRSQLPQFYNGQGVNPWRRREAFQRIARQKRNQNFEDPKPRAVKGNSTVVSLRHLHVSEGWVPAKNLHGTG